MISHTTVFTVSSTDPHRNLALEAILTETLPAGEAALMLWQNANTVVIGSGQNAWRECAITQIEKDSVTLARRPSGGGAVFHDLGNLNFSFLMPKEDYDVSRQLGVILCALQHFGIEAAPSGRNDLTVNGRKFSGNAFRFYQNRALHHGTLLLNADMQRGSRYLIPDPAKLKSKGVASVPARVINLSEIAPVTVSEMKLALEAAFEAEYGAAERVDLDTLALPGLEERIRLYSSWDWNYAASPRGEITLENRFEWGGIQLHFSVLNGKITDLCVYTDAMDECLAARVISLLDGCPCRADAVQSCLAPLSPELAAWLANAL